MQKHYNEPMKGSEPMKTIREVAEHFGITKTAVRKYMDDEFRKLYVETRENGTIYISEEGVKFLESLRKPTETTENKFVETKPETPQTQSFEKLEALYAEIIKAKNEEIERLVKENQELKDKNGQLEVQMFGLTNKVGNALEAITGTGFIEKMQEVQNQNTTAVETTDRKWWQFWKG